MAPAREFILLRRYASLGPAAKAQGKRSVAISQRWIRRHRGLIVAFIFRQARRDE
jgi:hypothetical protein